MNGYVLSVIGTVLLSAILAAILPEGKTAVTVKGVMKCACVLIIVTPVLSFFQSNDEILVSNSYLNGYFEKIGLIEDSRFIQYVSTERVKYAQECLEKELLKEYSAKVRITLEWREEERILEGYKTTAIKIEKISVQGIDKDNQKLRKDVLEYLTKHYCEEVLLE